MTAQILIYIHIRMNTSKVTFKFKKCDYTFLYYYYLYNIWQIDQVWYKVLSIIIVVFLHLLPFMFHTVPETHQEMCVFNKSNGFILEMGKEKIICNYSVNRTKSHVFTCIYMYLHAFMVLTEAPPTTFGWIQLQVLMLGSSYFVCLVVTHQLGLE